MKTMPLGFLIVCAALLITNPTLDEYVSWVEDQSKSTDSMNNFFVSLATSPIVKAGTRTKNLVLFSLYKTQFDDKTIVVAIGAFHHFINWQVKLWTPGERYPSSPHVIATQERDKWAPEDGYVWVRDPPPPGDLRVFWVDGRQSALYPHVVTAKTEGQWLPETGYEWVVSPPVVGDFRTRPKADLAARHEESRSLYQLKFDIKNMKDQIGLLSGRVGRLKPKSQELIAAFTRQSEKVERLLRQERSFVDVAERGQVHFAVSQAVTETENQIGEIISGAEGLANAIRDAIEGAKQISNRCNAPQFASEASLANFCNTVSDDIANLQAAIQQAAPTLRELERTYRTELAKQKRLQTGLDRLAN